MANTYEELMLKSRELHAAGDIDGARRVAKIALGRKAQSPAQDPRTISPEHRAANIAANAGSQAEIDAAAMGGMKEAGYDTSAPETMLEGSARLGKQFGAGSQRGIANMLGFPVDTMAGIINATGLADASNPVLGSEQIYNMMQPFRDGIAEPQTRAERMVRRVGEEVGSSAVSAPIALASSAVKSAPLLKSAMVEGASALGSGLGAATANELAPDSALADIAGSLLGGIPIGTAATKMTGLGQTPATVRSGIDEQRQIASDAYGNVRADTRVLPQDSVDDMALGLSAKMDQERINPNLQPGSQAILDAILRESSGPMRVEDIENLRRITQQSLPLTAPKSDQRLAGMMTDEITAYLDNLNDPIADELRTGRTAHRRAMAAGAVEEAGDKAQRRAATTGSGGNEINAMRQNIARMIESPRRARSFTPDELAQMDAVSQGTVGQNVARRLSRFAPSSGGLASMMGIGGAMASPAVALPIMAVTEGAKAFGERSTRKSIENLLQSLAPDRVLKPSSPGVESVIRALLAGRAIANQE